jgi:hypothetical protein
MGGKDYNGPTGSGMGVRNGLIWSRTRQLAGFFECGKEPSGSTKCGEFLDKLRTV